MSMALAVVRAWVVGVVRVRVTSNMECAAARHYVDLPLPALEAFVPHLGQLSLDLAQGRSIRCYGTSATGQV
jgi:hypothetical protein